MKLLSKIMITAIACAGFMHMLVIAQENIQRFVAYKANKTDYPENSEIWVIQGNTPISYAKFKNRTDEPGVKFNNTNSNIDSLYYIQGELFSIEFKDRIKDGIFIKSQPFTKDNISKIKIDKGIITPEYSPLPKPKLKSVDVYKEQPDGQEWEIVALPTAEYRKEATNRRPTEKPFGTTSFVRDTTGLRTKKLKFPINQNWELFVYKSGLYEVFPLATTIFKKGDVKHDSILILDNGGKARVAAKNEKPQYK
jgi:hypothetical protein